MSQIITVVQLLPVYKILTHPQNQHISKNLLDHLYML